MYITPKQLQDRLEGQSNLELKKREGVGRHKTLSHEEKVLIGVLARTDSQENVAKAFGTSQENVSMISRGVNGSTVNTELRDDIEKALPKVEEVVSSKAIDILLKSLEVVESKVNKESAKDASSIARNMSAVVKDFSPKDTSPAGFAPKILINIHGSKQKEERDFESITVEAVSQ